ncbi:serine hydrolase [Rhodococcus sp. SORGH_AS_0301]|uniref:serine hydrolase domain-containing protein n=1 Tax=Rhodococcus sp. SORGH_AS_0301 TaxID=3041780 RepID=UPI00277E5012|nr:serine hydrolase domain-containing protein [Rhodococcus sp. SORGH_AS_0301]MDQ1178619.1 CubicO group peptidase (beta-lactamase class C family) [Rhodococcus sp. SORGH_AS_0301]
MTTATATPLSPADRGIDADRLARLPAAIHADVAAAKFDGAVVLVARHGDIVLHEAIGYADRATNRALETNSVFTTFSILKQPTNATLLQKIDRGDIAFTTQVREVIPEYAQKGKGATTVADLLLHKAGLPHFPPLPVEQIGDIQAVTAAACRLAPQAVPGTSISYSAMLGHSVLAEIVRRIDGGHRSFGQIMTEDLFVPLGMHDTSFGSRADLVDRAVPVVSRDRRPGLFDAEMLEGLGAMMSETFELPAGGAWTTASDWFRFAEACRRGGELDGVRVLSPAVLRLARTIATGDLPNSLWDYSREMRGWHEFPAYLGPGFYLRGEGIFPAAFGTLASPSTFGGIGAGSNCFWIDPDTDLTYVFLSAGLMEDSYSWERHQRYADLVHSAVIR